MIDKTTRFKEIINEMYDTYSRKNSDYGDSFGESVAEFGPLAGVVRISDKFNRLKSLLNPGSTQKVNGESVMDTLTDLACYAIMLRMELENPSERIEVIVAPKKLTPELTELKLWKYLTELYPGEIYSVAEVPGTPYFEINMAGDQDILDSLKEDYNFL